ncbi:DUF3800 domain-containing protein [Brevundimonas sp. Root1423]|uniref:DUF3800 domain-containing protein n=1 Tax=Brevundimonas sp. Root1423 TaxID=1736462 RepID=UPI0006FE1BA9|nr:DUF3800 domain-containing protein [Brevundimonas sp. Root1423]KQY80370.1 hypothetical protein ASD25_09490 [Brevundimonas sp. Root1423]
MAHIAFIDESGDHGLVAVDPLAPVFVLAAVVYPLEQYLHHEIPAMSRLKIGRWGHEGVVLHAYDIRKRQGPFAFCANRAERDIFHREIGDFFGQSRCTIIASTIHKQRLAGQYVDPNDPYYLSVKFVLERLHMMCGANDQIQVVYEARGRTEDALVLEWSIAIAAGENFRGEVFNMAFCFAKKKHNVTGLQVADLACPSIAAYVLDHDTRRPDWLAVRPRIRQRWGGGMRGFGLKIFPP